MKRKRCLSFLLSAAMTAALAVSAPAEGNAAGLPGPRVWEQTEQNALFERYVDRLFLDDEEIDACKSAAEGQLTGVDWNVYEKLKEAIGEIAAGERSGTTISLSLEDVGITKTVWSAQDLGVPAIIEGNSVAADAVAALRRAVCPDFNRILNYLLTDCPYELYWFDKTSGALSSQPGMRAVTEDGVNWALEVTSGMSYSFAVAEEYQDAAAQNPEYTVLSSMAQTALRAASNAKAIVEKYASYSDYGKLEAYRKEICALTSYHNAAAGGQVSYGNPWQLIWVFDGDAATEVVCEGYAKAFQYLCDMSEFFSPDIRCCTVSGMMDGGTGAGGHMWNVVTMNDKKNYIVDITNCDEGTVGADDKLFMAGAQGSVADGYTVTIGNHRVSYRYFTGEGGEADMSELYGRALEISPSDFVFDYRASGKFESGIEWTLDHDGFLNIKGAGDMPEPKAETDYEAIPWYRWQSDIRKVVVEEGITSVANWAFFKIDKITEISLPEGLKKIGAASFALNGIQTLKLPETMETINMLAFFGCADLEQVTLPGHLKTIGVDAFIGCSSLKELTIPSGVTQIWAGAFQDCDSLEEVAFLGACPQFLTSEEETGSAFAGDTLTLYYPKEQESSWRKLAEEGFDDANVEFRALCAQEAHVWEEVIEQEPNCASEGESVICCSVCGRTKERKSIPAGAHQFSEWIAAAPAGCLTEGSRKRVCAVCQEEEAQIIPAAGHSWNTAYTTDRAATCQTEGQQSVHCGRCEAVKDVSPIPKSRHTLQPVQSGAESYYRCTVCGSAFSDAAGTTAYTGDGSKGGTDAGGVKVSNLAIKAISRKIAAGKKVTLTAEAFPDNAGQKDVVWETDQAGYATVNGDGVVTTKKAGAGKTVTVTATAADGSGVTASIKLKLMKDAVTGVQIKSAPRTLKAGKSIRLKAEAKTTGKNSNRTLQWTSSNVKYAVVDAKGKVKAQKAGIGKTVTLTAAAVDGSNKKAKVKIRIVR